MAMAQLQQDTCFVGQIRVGLMIKSTPALYMTASYVKMLCVTRLVVVHDAGG